MKFLINFIAHLYCSIDNKSYKVSKEYYKTRLPSLKYNALVQPHLEYIPWIYMVNLLRKEAGLDNCFGVIEASLVCHSYVFSV